MARGGLEEHLKLIGRRLYVIDANFPNYVFLEKIKIMNTTEGRETDKSLIDNVEVRRHV